MNRKESSWSWFDQIYEYEFRVFLEPGLLSKSMFLGMYHSDIPLRCLPRAQGPRSKSMFLEMWLSCGGNFAPALPPSHVKEHVLGDGALLSPSIKYPSSTHQVNSPAPGHRSFAFQPTAP